MPCRVESDAIRGLVRVRVEGPTGAAELFQAIERVWSEPAYRERPGVLWDIRRAELTGIQGAEMREILSLERRGRPGFGSALLAILVSSDLGYGMGRMLAALLEEDPIEVGIFRDDEESAWAWLEQLGDAGSG